MSPATERQTFVDGASASPLAARLELLLQHAITTEQFEADMVRICRQDPDEVWTLLALLDQHHRLESLPTELFRALKASADRNGLVRREPYIPTQTPKPRAPAPATPAPAPRAGAGSPPAPPRPAAAAQPAPSAPEPAAAPAAASAPAPAPAPAPAMAPPAVPPAAPARAVEVGSVIGGRYRLEAELESDDRGRNFQAQDLQHAGQPAAVSQVAVHCMQPDPANFEAVLAERRAEFQLAQPLTHPNVLSVRELDQDGVYIYLTMNWMRGETLSALLERRRGKALARPVAFAIIRDVGAALSYAHDHGVVHGNLQPQSILISPAGELRVRGFGAQRASSCYASGEQLENRTADRRDDLYALACISYELLHGIHPFHCQNASTARGRGMSPARPIGLSGRQWRAVRTGLAWRREGRNLSIARWIGRMQLRGASKPLPMLEDLMAMPPPRRSWWPAVLLIACLAAAAVLGLSLYRSPGLIDVAGGWKALRAAITARAQPAASEIANPASSAVADAPAPEAATASPPSSAPAPEAEAVTPASAAQTASPPAALPAPAPVPEYAPGAPAATNKDAAANPRAPSAAGADAPAPSVAAAAAPQAAPPGVLAATPKSRPVPAAKPKDATDAAAGPARIELSAERYTVQPGDSAAHIVVRRTGGARGEVRFAWWTENASASADLDFVAWGRRVERIPAGQSSATLLVPIIKDATRNRARTFYVLIGEAGGGAKVGGVTRAAVLLPGTG
jgi:hypothetical protein